MEKTAFLDGFFRLTRMHQVFVTEELTQIYWEILAPLTPAQWVHAVRVSMESPEDKKLPTTGMLLARGRTFAEPAPLALPSRTAESMEADRENSRRMVAAVIAMAERFIAEQPAHDPPKPRPTTPDPAPESAVAEARRAERLELLRKQAEQLRGES